MDQEQALAEFEAAYESRIAALRARVKELEAENAAIRALAEMLDERVGWTDAMAPMNRALAAEAERDRLRAENEAFRVALAGVIYRARAALAGREK